MRILDEYNVEITSPDYGLGYCREDRLFVTRHPAVEAVSEVFHYEYTDYPNGGRDRRKVVDREAVAAADAWDEYEDILRYVRYTESELAARQAAAEEAYRNSPEYRIRELEEALELLLSGVTE
ncbi:MAG: hypothetical protein IJD81_09160 [Oscillospiraceae bacterium]|nr:hypothetical protein [Oscillospiraceae bacterium]